MNIFEKLEFLKQQKFNLVLLLNTSNVSRATLDKWRNTGLIGEEKKIVLTNAIEFYYDFHINYNQEIASQFSMDNEIAIQQFLELLNYGLTVTYLSKLTSIKKYRITNWRTQRDYYETNQKDQNNIKYAISNLYNFYINFERAKDHTNYDDITGQKFNHLTALYPVGPTKNGSMQWACQCDCGNPELRITTAKCLKLGETVSCGCTRSYNHPMLLHDLTGQRFDKLLVMRQGPKSSDGRTQWWCKCDCGNEKLIRAQSLVSGKTRSCGCAYTSIGESQIENILKNYNINYVREFHFPDLKSPKGKELRFDFAIFDKNNNLIELIEFDGEQHIPDHELHFCEESLADKEYRLSLDKLKNNYCINNNLKLIRIPYTKKDKMTINDLELNDYI